MANLFDGSGGGSEDPNNVDDSREQDRKIVEKKKSQQRGDRYQTKNEGNDDDSGGWTDPEVSSSRTRRRDSGSSRKQDRKAVEKKKSQQRGDSYQTKNEGNTGSSGSDEGGNSGSGSSGSGGSGNQSPWAGVEAAYNQARDAAARGDVAGVADAAAGSVDEYLSRQQTDADLAESATRGGFLDETDNSARPGRGSWITALTGVSEEDLSRERKEFVTNDINQWLENDEGGVPDSEETYGEQAVEGTAQNLVRLFNPYQYLEAGENLADATDYGTLTKAAMDPAKAAESATSVAATGAANTFDWAKENPGSATGVLAAGLLTGGASIAGRGGAAGVSSLSRGGVKSVVKAEFDPRVNAFGDFRGDNRGQASFGTFGSSRGDSTFDSGSSGRSVDDGVDDALAEFERASRGEFLDASGQPGRGQDSRPRIRSGGSGSGPSGRYNPKGDNLDHGVLTRDVPDDDLRRVAGVEERLRQAERSSFDVDDGPGAGYGGLAAGTVVFGETESPGLFSDTRTGPGLDSGVGLPPIFDTGGDLDNGTDTPPGTDFDIPGFGDVDTDVFGDTDVDLFSDPDLDSPQDTDFDSPGVTDPDRFDPDPDPDWPGDTGGNRDPRDDFPFGKKKGKSGGSGFGFAFGSETFDTGVVQDVDDVFGSSRSKGGADDVFKRMGL